MNLTESAKELPQRHKPSDEGTNNAHYLKEELQKLVCEQPLRLRTIRDLLTESFIVPKYQRGYKWAELQVEQLIDDIEKHQDKDGFYCLQPIVVKRDDDSWELIDGQQRITTIFMILSYLKNLGLSASNFESLQYRTRDKSEVFLKDLNADAWEPLDDDKDNIDIHHFKKACRTIQDNFEKKGEDSHKEWIDKLLNHCKVIWYEVELALNEKSESVFRRLNSGKISLTNAELIKALFLINVRTDSENENSIELKKNILAREWDEIERGLQDEDFWSFLHGGQIDNHPTRIDFIFDLIVAKTISKSDQPYRTFRDYSDKLQKSDQPFDFVTKEWDTVKKCYYRLKAWFEDDTIYHKAGFILMTQIEELSELIQESKKTPKPQFLEFLTTKISREMVTYFKKAKSDDLLKFSSLEYGAQNKEIKHLLYLFNIHEHAKENTRFPFFEYAKVEKGKEDGGWSLEHIHATNSKTLSKIDLELYLEEVEKEIATNDQSKVGEEPNVESLSNSLKDVEDDNAEKIQKHLDTLVKKHIGEFGGDELSNMALLQKDHNSSLNDSIFSRKRNRIRELEKEGKWIPLATKRVFSKYYNEEIKSMSKWGSSERGCYKDAIQKCLQKYDINFSEEN